MGKKDKLEKEITKRLKKHDEREHKNSGGKNKSKAVSKAPTDYGEREKTRIENSGKTLSDAEDIDDGIDDKEVLEIIVDQKGTKTIASAQKKPKTASSANF